MPLGTTAALETLQAVLKAVDPSWRSGAKGDDYTATVTLYEDGALAAGLAGATATLRITDPAGTTTSKAGTVDADAGTVTASWTDTETTALAVGDHKFDVHVVKSGGVDLTYPKGGGYLTLRVVAPRSG